MVHEERREEGKRLLRVLSLFLHGYGWLAREAAAPPTYPRAVSVHGSDDSANFPR